jgi:hypothetical protein
MIHKIIFIDAESGFPLIETTTSNKEKTENGEESTFLIKFFNVVNKTIDSIQQKIHGNKSISTFTDTRIIDNMNIVMRYHDKGNFLISIITDLDDDLKKIIETINILARRFYQKHSQDLYQFRMTQQKKIFNSFIVDIKTFTFGGEVAENFPKLIVNEDTLSRLSKMNMITDMEKNTAENCDGKLSPLLIAKQLDQPHEEISKALEKLASLDIIKF